MKLDHNLVKSCSKFSSKNRNSFTKYLSLDEKYSSNVENFIKPIINSHQSSYLKNINDFDVRESITKSDERLLKYEFKKKK